MRTTLRVMDRVLALIEDTVLVLLLAALAGVAGGQILMRLGAGSGWNWAAEAERTLVLWLGFIGGAVASREARHIRIDIAPHLLPAGLRHPIRRLTGLLAAGTAGILGVVAVRFVLDEARYGTTTALGLPSWLPLAVLPGAFFLMAFHFFCHGIAREPQAPHHHNGPAGPETPAP